MLQCCRYKSYSLILNAGQAILLLANVFIITLPWLHLSNFAHGEYSWCYCTDRYELHPNVHYTFRMAEVKNSKVCKSMNTSKNRTLSGWHSPSNVAMYDYSILLLLQSRSGHLFPRWAHKSTWKIHRSNFVCWVYRDSLHSCSWP
jgi:hypothetical protein